MTTRLVSDYAAPDLVAQMSARSILIQPFGSLEQHGPHLPLATDSILVEASATALVERYGDEHDLWLLPTLTFTKSNEHAWSAGTVWLSATTMLAVIDDIARSLALLPAKRLVFLNGHGGNSALLNVACRDVRLKHGFMTFLAHPHVPADHGGTSDPGELGMGIHGGIGETSAMMHVRPDLVDVTQFSRNVPDSLADNEFVRFGGSVSFGWLSNDFGPEGHIGDPRGATAELGAKQFDLAVDILGTAMAEIAAFRFPRTD
jgi:creatinine amidohydrolase